MAKFTANDIAERLSLEPHQVRMKLRQAGIEKVDGAYGWNTEKELKDVIAAINGKGTKAPETAAAKTAPEKKSKAKAVEVEAPAKVAKKGKGKAAEVAEEAPAKPTKKVRPKPAGVTA